MLKSQAHSYYIGRQSDTMRQEIYDRFHNLFKCQKHGAIKYGNVAWIRHFGDLTFMITTSELMNR